MKFKVKDGKGKRVCTEIKRHDPAAVLVFDENCETEVSNEELHLLVTLGYIELKNVTMHGSDEGKVVKAVYPDAVVFDEVKKAAPEVVAPAVVPEVVAPAAKPAEKTPAVKAEKETK